MRGGLNLSSRPFVNEVAPWIGVGALALVTLGATAWHTRVLAELVGGRGSAQAAQVSRLQGELQEGRREERALQGPAVDIEEIRRWAALTELVNRRAFSWTLLLSRLEAGVPWDVRLLDISASGEGPSPRLSLTAMARSTRSALSFIEHLEQRPEFSDVQPQTLAETGEDGLVRVNYTLHYDPAAALELVRSQGAAAAPTAAAATARNGG